MHGQIRIKPAEDFRVWEQFIVLLDGTRIASFLLKTDAIMFVDALAAAYNYRFVNEELES